MLYSNYLRYKSQNAIKTAESEGYPLIMNKCKPGKSMKELEIYGNCYQATTGKNLFDIDNMTVYSGHSSYSIENGVLTVSQTSTGTYQSKNIAIDENLIGKQIVIYALAKTLGDNMACMRVAWFNGDSQVKNLSIITKQYSGTDVAAISATGVITEKPEAYPNAKLCIAFYSNGNATLESTGDYSAEYSNIQLEIGSSVTSYEPYIQKPTPDYPSEVQSVGELTTLNMFDMTKARTGVGIELHENENYFDIINNYACQFMSIENFMSLGFQAGDTITTVKTVEIISGEATGSSGSIILLPKSSTYPTIALSSKIGYQIMTTTLPADFDPGNYHGLYTYAISGTGTIRYRNVMMLKGSYTEETIPEYEPYHKYKIPIVLSRKNLFDVSKIVSNNNVTNNGDGTITAKVGGGSAATPNTLKDYCPRLRVGDIAILNYNISADIDDVSYASKIYLYGVNTSWAIGKSKVITQAILDSKVAWYPARDNDGNVYPATLSNIQIEKGSIATEYEPYSEPITQNVYLNEPLRGALYQSNEKQWYYDLIDYKTNKIIRNIAERTFTGATDEKWKFSKETDSKIHFFISNILNNCSFGGSTGSVICNKLNEHYQNATTNTAKEGISLAYTTNNCYIGIFKTRLTDAGLTLDLDGFKTWLSQNPITVTYILKTPIEEDISYQLPKTISKTTIMETDTNISPSNIKTKYLRT